MKAIKGLRPTVNQTVRCVCLVIIWLISACSLMLKPSIVNGASAASLRNSMGTVQLSHVLAAVFLAVMYRRMFFSKDFPFECVEFLLSILFALFLVIGFSFTHHDGFGFLLQNRFQRIVSLNMLLGYSSMIYALFKYGLFYYHKAQKKPEDSSVQQWVDAHLPFVCVVFMTISWTAMTIGFFPGSVPHDTQYQLNQFFGYDAFTNHHPWISTYLIGIFFYVGKMLRSYQLGALLYVIAQAAFGIAVFTEICTYMRKKGMSLKVVLLTLAYFCLTPVVGLYIQAIIKDSLYMIAFAWFVLEYVKRIIEKRNRWGDIRLIISAVLVCILRNNGVFIVVPALILLVCMVVDHKRLAACVLAVVCAVNVAQSTLMDAMGIVPGSVKEMMSIPFSCTARYARDYGSELTDEEIAVIDKILPYNELAASYNSQLSDPVKDMYKGTATAQDWWQYLKLWVRMMWERPLVYAEAIMAHTYGYLDPFYLYSGMGTYQTYNKGRLTGLADEPLYSIYCLPNDFRTFANEYGNIWKKIPVLSFFISPGTYSWICLLLMALLLKKKKWKELLLFFIPMATVAINILSPVNGFMRYTLPLVSAVPVLILYAWYTLKTAEQEPVNDGAR